MNTSFFISADAIALPLSHDGLREILCLFPQAIISTYASYRQPLAPKAIGFRSEDRLLEDITIENAVMQWNEERPVCAVFVIDSQSWAAAFSDQFADQVPEGVRDDCVVWEPIILVGRHVIPNEDFSGPGLCSELSIQFVGQGRPKNLCRYLKALIANVHIRRIRGVVEHVVQCQTHVRLCVS